MAEPFKSHIESLIPKEKKLLLGCSGGVDSVVLGHLLHSLGYSFGLAHCNFGLRGTESDEDEAFVGSLANSLEVPIHAQRFETRTYSEENNLSIQMAARALRYAWFEELRLEHAYDQILTAHHADDDLETFFINLSRGTGIRGLTGIPQQTETILRPLLPFGRDVILKYAQQMEFYWREDSSNARTDYVRNKFRHEVIPAYKAAVEQPLKTLAKTQNHLRDSAQLIEDYMALVVNLVVTEFVDGYSIDIPKLINLPNPKSLLYELLRTFGFTAWDDIGDLLTAQSGKQVMSTTHRVVKDRDLLLISTLPEPEKPTSYPIRGAQTQLTTPIRLVLETADRYEITNAFTIFVDADKLTFPLELRKWKEGDSFQPFGMEGKKKLSKFFKDEKLSLIAKQKVWVLCNEQEIVWVVGMRMDDRYKVSKDTQHIIRIAYTPENP
ncbi:MAG: tRNA lysidine(34) synthetase TilS [Bacteroidota bacterium]